MRKLILPILLLLSVTVNAQFTCGDSVSYGGKWYHTQKTGYQCWMVENLNAGIMVIGTQGQADNAILEKYCYNNLTANCTTYGGLYQWGEAMQYYNGATNSVTWAPYPTDSVEGICPTGWHIPSAAERDTLFTYLGGQSVAGGLIKEYGTTHWDSPNTGANNASNFTALGSGIRWSNGLFYYLKRDFSFWTTTQAESPSDPNTDAWYGGAGYAIQAGTSGQFYKIEGLAVRCVRFNPVPETQVSQAYITVDYNPTLYNVGEGNSVFSSSVLNCGTTPQYQWFVNGIPASGATNTTYTYSSIDDDVVVLFIIPDIEDAGLLYSNTIIMNVPAMVPVVPTITIEADATTVYAGTVVTFHSTVTNEGVSPTYQWSVGGTNISAATNTSYSYVPVNGDQVKCVLTVGASDYESNIITMVVMPIAYPCGTGTEIWGGVTYTTIQIGTQCWFGQNLDYGTFIPKAVSQTNNSTVEKWCYDDVEANCTEYGGYYQWMELMDYDTTVKQGLCPAGWHVADSADWAKLITYYAGYPTAGWRLKEPGYTHWDLPDPTTTYPTCVYEYPDTTGILYSQFNIRGNGLMSSGVSAKMKKKSYLWTSSEYLWKYPKVVSTNNSNAKIEMILSYRGYGYGARCIKD